MADVTVSTPVDTFMQSASQVAMRTNLALGATTDLAGGTSLTINTPYHDTFSAARTLTFSGTPAEGDLVALIFDVTGATRTITIPTSYRSGTSGTTTAIDFPVGNHQMIWRYADGVWKLNDSGPATVTEYLSGIFETGADDDNTVLLASPIAGTIVNTSTKCASGTATYTFKINTTALGGTANSVSSTESTQAHSSANAFVAGDDLVITRSADSTCVDASWMIEYTREV